MTRVIVTYKDGDGKRQAGWFNPDRAIAYSVGTKMERETLYRTEGGRWVLAFWDPAEGGEAPYAFIGFIDGIEARTWLIDHDKWEAAEEHFGPLEDESGPPVGADRPRTGEHRIEACVSEELVGALDARAQEQGIPRAEVIRHALAGVMLPTTQP